MKKRLVVGLSGASGAITYTLVGSSTGAYGQIQLNADGSYTYAVDNTNLTVQGLASGETLKDEFTYTLSDGLATDQATLSVTINGVDDPVSVTVPSSTVQTSPDGNVTDQVVFESGLAGGSNPHTADTKVDASFTLVALDGLDASAAIVIGYIDASGNPASLTLTKAEVEALDSTNKSIATQYGILVFDGYERGSDGTISIDYTYTLTSAPPVGGDSTNDSFTFTAKDGDGDTDAKVLNIKIVDDVPKAVVDTSAVKAGETLTATAVDGVLKNDKSGADGWVTGGAVVGVVKGGVGTSASGINTDIAGDYGTLKLQADGSYTYIANAAAPGAAPTTSDVFTYTVRDADGDETTSTLTITIQNNRQPVAMDDSRTTPEDTPLSGNVIGSGGTGDVADGDPDGDTLAVTKIVVEGVTYPVPANGSPLNVSIPGKGVLQFDKTGAYTFTPVADWHGAVPDITYTIDDGRGASNSTAPATLSIIVTPVVDVADDTATTRPSMPVTIPVLANDSFEGTPVVTGTTPPSNGTLTINADNTITYTPNPGFFGADSYTYMVTSGGVTETATVTVTVVSTPPLARDDVRTTPEDTPVRGNVLIGTGGDMADSDADNDPLTVTGFIVGGVSYIPGQTATIAGVGSLTLNADGSYTFTPVPDWNGSVPVVSYVVSDGTGASNSTAIATLTIVVTPVADVADDTASTLANRPVTTPVLGNDSFGNPDATITATTPPANGSIAINPDGSITYVPNPGFSGEDSYSYTVKSGGRTETATVRITVVPENPPSVVPPFEVVPPAPSLNVLQPANPLDRSPVILEPGPYFAGERFDDVRRLPLPFHPITYVHQQVVVSQTERAQDDPRAFGDPRAVTPDEYRPISLGAGLGFDPNLFVVHSVRDSQRMASDFDRMVEGRFGRIELDSDRYLLQPGLSHDGEHEIPSWLKQQEADGTQPTPTADEAATVPTDDADTPPPETDRPAAVSTRPSGGGAPSFAEQLRSGASRLPLAPRKV